MGIEAKRGGRKANGVLETDTDGRQVYRVTLATGVRVRIATGRAAGADTAEALPLVVSYARSLFRTGKWSKARLSEEVGGALRRVSELYTDGRSWVPAIKRLVGEDVVSKQVMASASPITRDVVTFREVAERWLSGELFKTYGTSENFKPRERARIEKNEMTRHVYPTLGHLPIDEANKTTAFMLLWKACKERGLKDSSAQQVWKLARRVLTIAQWPVGVIAAIEVAPNAMPHVRDQPARAFMLPNDELRVMRCTTIDIHRRMLFGFLAREGCRIREALAIKLQHVTEFGLDVATVDVYRFKGKKWGRWMMAPGTWLALKTYAQLYRPGLSPTDPVFKLDGVAYTDRDDSRGAEVYRDMMLAAGLDKDRPILFGDGVEGPEGHAQMRAHDLRALMITAALARGESDDWVRTRTGQVATKTIMIYRRDAESLRASGQDLTPLATALPEIRRALLKRPPTGKAGSVVNLDAHRVVALRAGQIPLSARPFPATVPPRVMAKNGQNKKR